MAGSEGKVYDFGHCSAEEVDNSVAEQHPRKSHLLFAPGKIDG